MIKPKSDIEVMNEKNDIKNIIMNQYEKLSQKNLHVNNVEKSFYQKETIQIFVHQNV